MDAAKHDPPLDWSHPLFAQADLPVVGVSWIDAVAYCAWRSGQDGRPVRLPTEAEWEFAARGPQQALFPWGDVMPEWIPNGGRSVTGAVAGDTWRADRFGLLGIATNVHEWCADWHDKDYYGRSPERNPAGPDHGVRRAARGGAWRHARTICRVTLRSKLDPSFRYNDWVPPRAKPLTPNGYFPRSGKNINVRQSTRSPWPILTLVVALTAASSCTPGSTSSVTRTMPVQLVNNLVFVSVRVGSSEALSFILDTGASATVLHRTVAERSRLDLRASEDARTGGGSVQTATATGITLFVGNASLPDVTLVAIDLSGLQAGLGRPVDGILGYDIFRRYVVEIDYAANAVRLHDPAGYRYDGQGDILPIVIEEQIPLAQIGYYVLRGSRATRRWNSTQARREP